MDTRKKLERLVAQDKYTNDQLAEAFGVGETTIRRWLRKWGIKKPAKKLTVKQVREQVQSDRKLTNLSEKSKVTNKKYKALLLETDKKDRQIDALLQLTRKQKPLVKLQPRKGNGKHEAVANVLLSDYHLEERVLSDEVEGRNEYNLEISKSRLQEFFRTTLRYVQIEKQNTEINQLVVWLLGDNITGWLHEESIHTTLCEPTMAAIKAKRRLQQGIQFLLDNSELKLTIPCVVGNHGRMTKRPNHATENGNSLEHIVYTLLDDEFRDNDRVEFQIPKSGFAFVDEFGFVIRGTHGHRIRYMGGVQGIGVPASKKLAQWNKIRHADLDVFGHHHTAQDGENFVVNGSVIGFNSYAYKEGFSFQPPEQKFFIVHSKWGRRNLSRSIFFKK